MSSYCGRGHSSFKLLMLSAVPPRVDLCSIGVDSRLGIVLETVHRESFLLFPALHGPNIPLYVGGDFLPGVQPVTGGSFTGSRGLYPCVSRHLRQTSQGLEVPSLTPFS